MSSTPRAGAKLALFFVESFMSLPVVVSKAAKLESTAEIGHTTSPVQLLQLVGINIPDIIF